MKKISKPSESEIIESLQRSGYLLESEISKYLASRNFFVESNQVIKDPITGKSREIDLTAEYYTYDPERAGHKVATKIRYVFEIKNNIQPVVLLTNYQHSPNQELYDSVKTIRTGNIPSNDLEMDFFDHLIPMSDEDGRMYSQYCSFQQKKGETNELMATHPEEIYSGLAKITQYCEEAIEVWDDEGEEPVVSGGYNKHDYYRNFLYLPVLLIKDDLFELDINEQSTPTLRAVPYSRFILNYHFKEDPKTALVYFVTKEGLAGFLQDMLAIEKKIEALMLEQKKQFLQPSDE